MAACSRSWASKCLDEYEDAIGWTNGKTRFWIGQADPEGRKHKPRTGDVGFHHYAFQLRSRRDVDALQSFLLELGAEIVDPAGEYYEDYFGCVLPRPGRAEARGHEVWRADRAGREGLSEAEERGRPCRHATFQARPTPRPNQRAASWPQLALAEGRAGVGPSGAWLDLGFAHGTNDASR